MAVPPVQAATVAVGSKNFNESYLLAEMAAQLLEAGGHPCSGASGSAAR
jgi:glycine betaine/choline ABC-type transport system substrate-binding protein